jgi:hypothetical protein
MIARELLVQDGCLSHRSSRYALLQAAGKSLSGPLTVWFYPPFYGTFFSSGQRCSFQCLIACSSRWLARGIGFCRESPSISYHPTHMPRVVAPNSLRITIATLWHVHIYPLKPCARAPWAKSSGNWARSWSLRRGVAPGGGSCASSLPSPPLCGTLHPLADGPFADSQSVSYLRIVCSPAFSTPRRVSAYLHADW